MAEVLVVAELVDGAVTKPTLELLTLARRLGDPVVVVFGDGAEAVAADGRRVRRHPGAVGHRPGHRRLPGRAQGRGPGPDRASRSTPAAVLITSTAEGKEIAGRLAVKLGSGLITDATDIAADGTTTQSVFAGNWTGSRASVEPGRAGGHGQAERRRPGAGAGQPGRRRPSR